MNWLNTNYILRAGVLSVLLLLPGLISATCKADTIINMPAFNTVDAQTMKKEEIDVWDSWPVQDAESGVVSNWNGYQFGYLNGRCTK